MRNKLEKRALDSWKLFSDEAGKLRARKNKFLQLRAYNLLSKALTALFKYTRDNEMERKLNKVAAFVFLERMLKKVMTGFKAPLIQKRKAEMIELSRGRRVVKSAVQIWKMQYLRKDLDKRVVRRVEVQTIRATFVEWR